MCQDPCSIYIEYLTDAEKIKLLERLGPYLSQITANNDVLGFVFGQDEGFIDKKSGKKIL